MKQYLTAVLIVMSAWTAHAQTTTESFTYTPGIAIPDGNNSGIVNVQNSPFTITSITDIQVTLNIAGAPLGGFNGDLYVQLTHAGGLSVLLNRPNKSLANTVGASDGGLVFVFDDGAAVNSHDYVSPGTPFAQVAGTFQPDARTTDPLLVLDTDPIDPTATLLGAFAGLDPAGDWNLLLVDNQGGTGDMVLNSWTLSITGTGGVVGVGGVPEPGTLALFAVFMGALPLVRRWRTKPAS